MRLHHNVISAQFRRLEDSHSHQQFYEVLASEGCHFQSCQSDIFGSKKHDSSKLRSSICTGEVSYEIYKLPEMDT